MKAMVDSGRLTAAERTDLLASRRRTAVRIFHPQLLPSFPEGCYCNDSILQRSSWRESLKRSTRRSPKRSKMGKPRRYRHSGWFARFPAK